MLSRTSSLACLATLAMVVRRVYKETCYLDLECIGHALVFGLPALLLLTISLVPFSFDLLSSVHRTGSLLAGFEYSTQSWSLKDKHDCGRNNERGHAGCGGGGSCTCTCPRRKRDDRRTAQTIQESTQKTCQGKGKAPSLEFMGDSFVLRSLTLLVRYQGKEKKPKPQWGESKKEKKNKAAPPKKEEFVNTTPKGEKKDLSKIPMADGYNPAAVEAAWQDWWEAKGFYSCDPKKAMDKGRDEKFVMVIPPPNVTGSLHLGHALTAAVEDTLTRWHRMKGHATLYVPGKFDKTSQINNF